eukprot:CAMPEP_0195303112 /NCGR_PEP_ID=MMETSP0707-20130614/32257_1 /TAXON_ID=33640 /ORGANISM="Asterionellopsis glacialis, Strain CCMP134" /LENGTH=237 /DNA_ID=CAMNT_0040366563 /DNA_START=66 /DNA_END=779 /DNA_ORIENTATION=-
MASVVATGPAQEAFSQLKGNLNKYTRANDRRMVLRSLKDVKYLMDIPLESIQLCDDHEIPGMEEEVSKERVTLNGVQFVPLSNSEQLKGQKLSEMLLTLKELCKKLCQMEDVTVDAFSLYDSLVQRMSPSNASADSYFKLNSLLGSPDLLVMPVTAKTPTPIRVNLYVSRGTVHATISSYCTYGIFRKADVKPADMHKGTTKGRAWIDVHSIVDERVNFTNGESVRALRVKLPDSYY